jgi:hypothetical protein
MVGYNQLSQSYGPGSSLSALSKQTTNSQVAAPQQPMRSQNIIGASQLREVVNDRGSRNVDYNFEMQNKTTPNSSFPSSQHQAAYSSNNNGGNQTANTYNLGSAQAAYSSSSSETNKSGYNPHVSSNNAQPSGGINRFSTHNQYEPSYGVDNKVGSNGPTSVSTSSNNTTEIIQSLASMLHSRMNSGGLNPSMRHEPYNPATSAAGSSAYSAVTPSSTIHATVGGQAGAVAHGTQYGGTTAHYDMQQGQSRSQAPQNAQHNLDADKRDYYFDDHLAPSSRLGASVSAKPVRASNTHLLDVETAYSGDQGHGVGGYRATAARPSAQGYPSMLSAGQPSALQGPPDYKSGVDSQMHSSHSGPSSSYDPAASQQSLHGHVSHGYSTQPRKEASLSRGPGLDTAAYYQQKDYPYQHQGVAYSDNSNPSYSTSGVPRIATNESYATSLSMPGALSHSTSGVDSGYPPNISSRVNSTIGGGGLPGSSNAQFESFPTNDKLNRGQIADMSNLAPKTLFHDSVDSSVHAAQNPLPYSSRNSYSVTQGQHNGDEYGSSDVLARVSGASSIPAPRGDYYPAAAAVSSQSTAAATGIAASATPFIPGDVRYRRQNNAVAAPTTALPGENVLPFSIPYFL